MGAEVEKERSGVHPAIPLFRQALLAPAPEILIVGFERAPVDEQIDGDVRGIADPRVEGFKGSLVEHGRSFRLRA